MQRQAGDFRRGIPARHFNGANGDRTFGVAAGFFPLHHSGENFFRIEVVTGRVEQRFRFCFQDARNKTRAHLRAASITSGGVEGEPDDGFAVTYHVGDHGNHRSGHLAEIEHRVAQVRIQRD